MERRPRRRSDLSSGRDVLRVALAALLLGCAPPHVEDIPVPAPADASQGLDSATLADVVDASIIDASDASPPVDASRCSGGPIVKVRLTVGSGGVGRVTFNGKRDVVVFHVPYPYQCFQGELGPSQDAGADFVVSCLGDDRGTWMRVTPRGDLIIIDGKDYESIAPFHMEVQLAPCSTVDIGVGQMKQGLPH